MAKPKYTSQQMIRREEYKAERKRIYQAIRRLEKKGVNVSRETLLPPTLKQLRKTPTKKEITKLTKITPKYLERESIKSTQEALRKPTFSRELGYEMPPTAEEQTTVGTFSVIDKIQQLILDIPNDMTYWSQIQNKWVVNSNWRSDFPLYSLFMQQISDYGEEATEEYYKQHEEVLTNLLTVYNYPSRTEGMIMSAFRQACNLLYRGAIDGEVLRKLGAWEEAQLGE